MKLEVNMVASDALKAADYYAILFNAEIVSKTNLEKELNEAVIRLSGVDVRILNENPEYQLVAPTGDAANPMWINLLVDDIDEVCDKVFDMGGKLIQPIMTHEELKVKNAVVEDTFHHIWVLNQVI